LGNKKSRPAPVLAEGEGSSPVLIDPDKNIWKQVKALKATSELAEKPMVRPLRKRTLDVPLDDRPHVALSLVLEGVDAARASLERLEEVLTLPSKSTEDVEALKGTAECMEVLLLTIDESLRPILSDPGARLDDDFEAHLAVVAEELAQACDIVFEARSPESAFSLLAVQYVVTYFLGSDVKEAEARTREQMRVLAKLWEKSYRGLTGRLEGKLAKDDARLAEIEQYCAEVGISTTKEYTLLVKEYEGNTRDLLFSIKVNKKGMSRYKKMVARLKTTQGGG
jgi:hypothetical protein